MTPIKVISVFLLALAVSFFAFTTIHRKPVDKSKSRVERAPDIAMVKTAAILVDINITPSFNYSYAIMKPGVYQHLDRLYTYDVVPSELLNGLLFQGIHRTPKGTKIQFTLHAPATVYFFFQKHFDGGYTSIFETLTNWKRMEQFPQYDIYHGVHGLSMVMYKLEAEAGSYSIPATTENNACFNIVFQKKQSKQRK